MRFTIQFYCARKVYELNKSPAIIEAKFIVGQKLIMGQLVIGSNI